MNVDFYSTLISCYNTTFKKGNFGILPILMHWKLKVYKYYEIKISSKRDMCETGGIVLYACLADTPSACD